MEISFGQKYWGLILLISLLIAAGITILLYYKNSENKELTKGQRYTLIILRVLSVFFIAFLLANPLIKTLKKITQHPVLILAIDNSQSMAGISGIDNHKPEINKTVEEVKAGLKNKFDIITYTFGEKTERNDRPDFTGKSSDYGEMLQTIYDHHFNENIGALIVIGDGIYNKGENPQTSIKEYHFPVYTLGLGDTTTLKDGRISGVRVNNTAFMGNQFPAEADIKITGYPGRNLEFSVVNQGRKVYSQNIRVNSPDFFTTIPFLLDATNKGIQYYSMSLEVLEGEKNKANNLWTSAINVLENKQKIVILSEGAHPDAGALKYALEQQINYNVSLFTFEPYPADLKDINLLVLNQLPSTSQSGRQIFEQSATNRIPMLILVGTQTYLSQFNLMVPGVEIIPRAGNFEEAQISLNEQFVSFTLSDALKQNLAKYPPLKVPFARYSLDPAFQNIAFQRIKNINTPWPAIAAGTINGRKVGIIFGEGIWRWRLYNYTIAQSHREFNEFVDKLVQYLALRDNSDNFTIDYKPVYDETENIGMTAEVYNDAFELINTPEVLISLTDSTGKEFNYTFDRNSQFYRLDAGIFPPGNYTFKAKTSIGTNEYTENGNFAVMPVNVENLDTRANHRILNFLAWETNGRFFQQGETDLLIQSIIENQSIKTTNYFQTLLNEILNLRWIFFVLLLLLSSEWFLRKFWGIY